MRRLRRDVFFRPLPLGREWSEKTSLRPPPKKKNLEKKSIWMVRCRAQTYVRPTRGRAVTHKQTHKQTNIPNRPCPPWAKLTGNLYTHTFGVVKEHSIWAVLTSKNLCSLTSSTPPPRGVERLPVILAQGAGSVRNVRLFVCMFVCDSPSSGGSYVRLCATAHHPYGFFSKFFFGRRS